MLSAFIDRQLVKAAYKPLEDGSFFGEIPEINGVWANAETLEACRNELREILESWIVLSLKRGDTIPDLEAGSNPSKRQYA